MLNPNTYTSIKAKLMEMIGDLMKENGNNFVDAVCDMEAALDDALTEIRDTIYK